jgi:uncharacterized protein YbjT (DUF2867 family)
MGRASGAPHARGARTSVMKAVIMGATGFVGGRLAVALTAGGEEVRCLVRDRARGAALEQVGCELHEGDALRTETLRGAGRGADVLYYLIHSMGRGGDGDFEARERAAAANVARMARDEGIERVIYLGGLGEPSSPHLRSRLATARTLAAEGPPLTHFRAAMVVGAGSESFRTLYYLAKRLPLMVAPAWLRTRTQPLGIHDLIAYLCAAPAVDASRGREVEVGGPDILSYGAMLDTMARALGRRPPLMVPVPLLTPALSSLWIGLVTPVDAGVARPLVQGLSTETVVRDPSGAALFDVVPRHLVETVREALEEQRTAAPR